MQPPFECKHPLGVVADDVGSCAFRCIICDAKITSLVMVGPLDGETFVATPAALHAVAQLRRSFGELAKAVGDRGTLDRWLDAARASEVRAIDTAKALIGDLRTIHRRAQRAESETARARREAIAQRKRADWWRSQARDLGWEEPTPKVGDRVELLGKSSIEWFAGTVVAHDGVLRIQLDEGGVIVNRDWSIRADRMNVRQGPPLESNLCGGCSGSGEGPGDGTVCRTCSGAGEATHG